MSEEKKFLLNVSVRQLVEYTLRSGDLVSDVVFTSGDRALEGIRAHQKVQESRGEEYQAEVTLALEIQQGEYQAKVTGRMDGIFVYDDRCVVDEIKSTRKNPEVFETQENLVHWGQAKVYAYIYGKKNHLAQMGAQLTYINTDSGDIREYEKTFSMLELESYFEELFERWLRWAVKRHHWQEERDQSIKELSFPFETYRPGQRPMALAVYRAIENQEQLIVEAPTGIGKTMAAIFPAVKAMGNGLCEKFFYLTAKTTGRMVAQTALEDLRKKGLKFKALTLTAKDKICFNPGNGCNGDECEYARGFFDRINEAVENMFQQEALTRETIEEGAERFEVCPFELALELSLYVDAIICDYNYAFDPRVFLRRFFGEESEERNYSFLVDEANNLVDRSREMFSAELYKQPLLDLRRVIKGKLPEVYRSLGRINNRLVTARKECEEAGQPLAQEEYPADISPLLRRFTRAAEKWLVKNNPASYRNDVMDLYFQVNWFLKVAENYDHTYSICMEKTEDDFRLKLYCLDPAEQLTDAMERSLAVVFFSATLSPLEYFRRVLGCEPEVKEMILPSPFPRENLFLPVMDRVSTLYKYRERTKMTVARAVDILVRHQPGNYLVFFPSYVYMKKVYDLFTVINPHVERLVQTGGMTEQQREEFLENFSKDNRADGKTLVGFAVMGGIFGEGIDLKGDRLTGAVIVGVGLPGISLERELIKDYFERQEDMGFQYAYLFPGLNRVFQAVGRVIRSDEDKGTVLLIGHRFSAPQYRNLFPGHWNPVRVWDEKQLIDVLARK